jgi:uncharacterized lipoprotein YddW (UPF0748 family)
MGKPAPAPNESELADIPKIPREMRGVWVATVGRIDWPKSSDPEKQKQELIAIMDKCAEIHLNAVVFQVRPSCDAMYESKIEPWSEFLTGVQGKSPGYDPLQFAIEEAHKRGLELHCWFNPYRARLLGKNDKVTTAAPNHISQTHPELVKKYGSFLWLDPGEKAVQDYSLSVIFDVVKRYDIDGVHMDDYFYPYKEVAKDKKGKDIILPDGKKKILDFPDDDSWGKYKKSGGDLSRNDWRRKNVDDFIERLYKGVKDIKPKVKVGLSPFGIWRPHNPPQIEGLDQYNELYSDAKLWLNNGWVDYWTPQLYWTIEKPQQSFPVLLKWWEEQNLKHRHLWPGLYTGKVSNGAKGWPVSEVLYQMEWIRLQPGADGEVHFSMNTFMHNTAGINDDLTTSNNGLYYKKALMPATPWLDDQAPPKPSIAVQPGSGDTSQTVTWTAAKGEQPFVWSVYKKLKNNKGKATWSTDVLPAGTNSLEVGSDQLTTSGAVILVGAVDRLGNESDRAAVHLSAGGTSTD